MQIQYILGALTVISVLASSVVPATDEGKQTTRLCIRANENNFPSRLLAYAATQSTPPLPIGGRADTYEEKLRAAETSIASQLGIAEDFPSTIPEGLSQVPTGDEIPTTNDHFEIEVPEDTVESAIPFLESLSDNGTVTRGGCETE